MGIHDRFTAWNAVSPAARKLQQHYVRRFTEEFDWRTVKAEQISIWIHRDGWAANTRVVAYASIKKFYYWACDVIGERDDNPMRHVSRPKPRRGLPRPVPEDLLRTVLGDVTDEDTALMLRLGALQGLRRAEIANLRVSDVDFERGVILVRGKGDKVRSVPLHPDVRPLLAGRGGEWVFPSRSMVGPISTRTVARRVTTAMGGGFTAHQLRHRFASAIYEASGHDLRVTQELLGHASVATTQIYTAVSSEAKVTAVGLI